ncbi:OsmC family protein [Sphingosinicella rhizophila]|uniref:OsmC family protein n=1 Tax=Sphingosinicella rhizophila TaxID=3050082 RepID=A0ABU3Q462_9SPHN|nr:OsmC family protein [Sphingosinicella sp. GR2756]MDT9598207.1 OsmC family protein [Sphingosinicella sp. GR2756]
MADYKARLNWASDGEFRSGRYSRAHRWIFDGGAVVPASSSPHVVPLPMSDPGGVDPEEALIASVSSCHMLWFLSLAQEEGFDVLRYEDEATGRMGRDERGRIGMTRIVLRPKIAYAGDPPDPSLARRMHDAAHEKCFIANSLRTEILVEF